MNKYWNNKNGTTSSTTTSSSATLAQIVDDNSLPSNNVMAKTATLSALGSMAIKKEIFDSDDNSSTITKTSDHSSSTTNTLTKRFNLRQRKKCASKNFTKKTTIMKSKEKNINKMKTVKTILSAGRKVQTTIAQNKRQRTAANHDHVDGNNQQPQSKRLQIKKELENSSRNASKIIEENGGAEEGAQLENGKTGSSVINDNQQQTSKMIIYNLNDFLAVRNEANSFFLCRAKQNIYKNGRKIKIQWYNNDAQAEVYTPDFYDYIDFECILTNLRINRLEKGEVSLPIAEKNRALNILNRAINVEKGINEPPDPRNVLSDGLDISIIGKVADEDVLSKFNNNNNEQEKDDQNCHEKNVGQPQQWTHSKNSLANGLWSKHEDNIENHSETMPIKKKTKSLNYGKEPSPLSRQLPSSTSPFYSERYLLVHDELCLENDRPQAEVSERNIEFETRTRLPFISTHVNSKLLIRAVHLEDYDFLFKLIEEIDRQHDKVYYKNNDVCSVSIQRSVSVKTNAIHCAILKQDWKCLKLLSDIDNRIDYGCSIQQHLPYSMELFHSELMMDQHLHERFREKSFPLDQSYAKFILKQNHISPDFCWRMIKVLKNGIKDFSDNIFIAIKYGNYDLASFLTRKICESNQNQRMEIYNRILSPENLWPENDREWLECCVDDSLKLYPIHIAAINPDPRLFNWLINICSNQIYVSDCKNWMPIHFASVCQTFFNLKHLLNLGVCTRMTDSKGNTALHLATKHNRIENVALIIGYERRQPLNSSSIFNSYNHKGYTPLHIACQKGFQQIVAMFIHNQVQLDFATSNHSGELTSLMIAAKYGHLAICKMLIENGANCMLYDKKNRSALTYAVINGHSNIVRYLLELGANPSAKDLFGNNLFHYALAYGWHSCYELLAKTNINLKDTNTFGLTPIYAAFMKGHIGFIDYILKKNILSVNVPVNDTGINLVMLTFSMRPSLKSLDYLRLFVEKFKCDLSKTDYEGNNALHYLLKCEAKNKNSDPSVINSIEKALTVLLQNGCDIYLENHVGISPIKFSLLNQCFVSFSQFFKDHHHLNCFQEILSTSEFLWPMIITNCLTESSIRYKNGPMTFGQYIMNISAQDKNFQDLLKSLSFKTNVSGDLPIEYLVKMSKHLLLNHGTSFESKLMRFFDFILQFYEQEFLEDICLLHLAARFAPSCIVNRLVEMMSYKVDCKNELGQSPLATAIINDNICAAEVFLSLKNEINVNFEIENEPCLLYYLKRTAGSVCLIESFLKHWSVNLRTMTDHDGNSALHLVCESLSRNHSIDAARWLIEQAKVDVNKRNVNKGQTALHVAFKMNMCNETLCDIWHLLANTHIDVYVKDSYGYNAFSYLFRTDFPKQNIIHMLKKLDLNRINLQQLSDANQTNLLQYSCKCGLADCTEYLLTNIDPNLMDKLDQTALSYAILNGHRECALMLLKSDNLNLLDSLEMITMKKDDDNRNLLWKIWSNGWKDVFFLVEERFIHQNDLAEFLRLLIKAECLEYALWLMKMNKSTKDVFYLKTFGQYACYSEKSIQSEFMEMFHGEQVESILIDLFTSAINNWNANVCFKLINMFGMQKLVMKLEEKKLNCISMSFKTNFIQEKELTDGMKDLIVKFVQEQTQQPYFNVLSTYPIVERNDLPNRYSFTKDKDLADLPVNYSPLIVSVILKRYQTVRWLLTHINSLQPTNTTKMINVDVNFVDSQGRLPLVHAILNNDLEMVRLLLDCEDDNQNDHKAGLRFTACSLLKRDQHNQTVFHHLIMPFENGTFFQAQQIYQILWNVLLSDSSIPSDKITELTKELSKFALDKKIFCMLPVIIGKHQQQQKMINGTLGDNSQQPSTKRTLNNFRSDYEAFLRESLKYSLDDYEEHENETNWSREKLRAKHFKMRILSDHTTSIPFDVMFTKLDSQKNDGSTVVYNFYKVQLLTVGSKFCLVIRWGQVGTFGNIKKLFYDNKDEAIKIFKKIFMNKSGENWTQVNTRFLNKQDKYKVVASNIIYGLKKRLNFNDLLKKLMMMMEPNNNQQTLLIHQSFKELSLRFVKKLELIDNQREVHYENLSTKSMECCSFILNRLSKLIAYNNSNNYKNEVRNQKEYLKLLNDMIDLSEQFYVYIKIFGNEFDSLKPILRMEDIEEKSNLVKKLKSIVFGLEFLFYLLNMEGNMNPWDYFNSMIKWNSPQMLYSKEEENFVKFYLSKTIVNYKKDLKVNIFKWNNDHQMEECNDRTYLLWYHLKNYEFFDLMINGFENQTFLLPTDPKIIVNGISLTNRIVDSNLSGCLLLCETLLENPLEMNHVKPDHSKLIMQNHNYDCIILKQNQNDCLIWKGFIVPIHNHQIGEIQFICLQANKKVWPRYMVEWSV